MIAYNKSGDDSHREQFWAEHSSEYLHFCHQGRRSDISCVIVMIGSFQSYSTVMISSYH